MIPAESKPKWEKVSVNEFVESHGGKLGDISIYGQEGNAPTRRLAVMNLANGSMSSNQSGEGDIRRALIEADLVDCMVALPGQLFYSTQITVSLRFLAKSKAAAAKRGFRDRRKQTLFIDARKRKHTSPRLRRLTDNSICTPTTRQFSVCPRQNERIFQETAP